MSLDRNRLFESNKALVYACWHRWRRRLPPREWDDLLQELFVAFWRACQMYDPERNVALSTFAFKWMDVTAFRYVRRFASRRKHVSLEDVVRWVPVHADSVESAALARAAISAAPPILKAHLAGATEMQIAAALGISQGHVSRLLRQARRVWLRKGRVFVSDRFVFIQGRGLARVNWYRDGLLGLSFVDGPSKGLHGVVREDEVTEWVGGKTGFFDAVRSMSDEELRARLEEIRAARTAPKAPKRARKSAEPDFDLAALSALPDDAARALLAAIQQRLGEAGDANAVGE